MKGLKIAIIIIFSSQLISQIDKRFQGITLDILNDMIGYKYQNNLKALSLHPIGQNQLYTNDQIIPDFQVNENEAISGARQYYSSISSDDQGNFVVVWTDCRNADADIYFQRYSYDGAAIGHNIRVNDDNGNSNQESPSISMDKNGNYAITWMDFRNGNFSIYAQLYRSDGTKYGKNFQVNENVERSTGWWDGPSIAMNHDGDFVITWSDRRNGNPDIYAQQFLRNGKPIGSNFKINDDTGYGWQCMPVITMDDEGNFIIAWDDRRNYEDNIYAQCYSYGGIPVGNNFKVNEGHCPFLVKNGNDKFIISWMGIRRNEIFVRQYSSKGNPLGDLIKVDDDQNRTEKWLSTVAINTHGNFLIVWSDCRDKGISIYAQCFSADMTPAGANFKINDGYSPSVTNGINGYFIVSWSDDRNEEQHDIYAKLLSDAGNPYKSDFKVNDDKFSANQKSSSITVNGNGDFVITWMDNRNGNYDIYAQRYLYDGKPLGKNFKVNDDTGNKEQIDPAISGDSDGNFVITWVDSRNGDDDIYAQCYLSDGNPSGNNFKVNDQDCYRGRNPSIAMNNHGNFIIVWENWEVYAKRFNSDGSPIGKKILICRDYYNLNYEICYKPSICINSDGNFVVAWNAADDIYAQCYSWDGTPIGSFFRVNDDKLNVSQQASTICSDMKGNFIIAWLDERDNEGVNIYAQRYLKDGFTLGLNFKVSDFSMKASTECNPSISQNENGNFAVVWNDSDCSPFGGESSKIYVQTYSSYGERIDSNSLVTKSSKKAQLSPEVKLFNNKIYSTWTDNRAGCTAFDIWANVLDWNNFLSEYVELLQTDSKFSLYQNYPNPFNPSTTIKYSIPIDVKHQTKDIKAENEFNSNLPARQSGGFEGKNVSLIIYDILGHEIATLVNQKHEPGNYEVEFSAKSRDTYDLPSGIYFYQLRTDEYTVAKKMVLLK